MRMSFVKQSAQSTLYIIITTFTFIVLSFIRPRSRIVFILIIIIIIVNITITITIVIIKINPLFLFSTLKPHIQRAFVRSCTLTQNFSDSLCFNHFHRTKHSMDKTSKSQPSPTPWGRGEGVRLSTFKLRAVSLFS